MSIIDLELKRRKIKNKLLKFRLVISIFAIVISFVILWITKDIIFAIIGGIFGYISIRNKICSKFLEDIKQEFKYEVVRKTIREISPNLSYERNRFIPQWEFKDLNIYDDYDYFKGNDLISGKFENVNVYFSDLCVEKEQKTSKYKTIVKVFYGIMFVAKFNKKFSTKTIILDKNSNAKFRMQKSIKLDNSEFSNRFKVYSKDLTQCFYLITPKFMLQILKLRKKFDCPINFVFDEGNLILFIERNFDSFEIDINRQLVGKNSFVEDTKRDILRILNIVKELDLNTKIFDI